jgi:hypothetical protein
MTFVAVRRNTVVNMSVSRSRSSAQGRDEGLFPLAPMFFAQPQTVSGGQALQQDIAGPLQIVRPAAAGGVIKAETEIPRGRAA